MADEAGPSEAWVEAVGAIARIAGLAPLPREVVTAENADWKLTINMTEGDHNLPGGNELNRFGIFAEGKKYLVFGFLDPGGGMIGGMPEDQFIVEMKAQAS